MIVELQPQENKMDKQRTHEQVMCLFQFGMAMTFMIYPSFHYYAFLMGIFIMTNLLAPRQIKFMVQTGMWILNLVILEAMESRGHAGVTDTKVLMVLSYFLQAANLRFQMELLDEVAGATWVYGQTHVLQLIHWNL